MDGLQYRKIIIDYNTRPIKLYFITYSNWKISEAKARLSELVHACEEGPQVLYNRGRPVAAVIDIQRFEDFQRNQARARQPSIAALLNELEGLNAEEADFGEPPQRTNRPIISYTTGGAQ